MQRKKTIITLMVPDVNNNDHGFNTKGLVL